jgi:hypothetical protein
VYRIATSDGKSVDVTSNHKFPTEDGIRTIETGLNVGTVIYTLGERVKVKNTYNLTDGAKIRGAGSSYVGCGFQSGENNVGFVNGNHIKFTTNRDALEKEANGSCTACEMKIDRLECHHIDGDRTKCIEMYAQWILKQPDLICRIGSLVDKTLGCFCKPLDCHGDVLIELTEKYKNGYRELFKN